MDFFDEIGLFASDNSKIAQIYREETLTYKELKEKSDALACYILDKLGDDKSPIIVYGHKQKEMLISFFACSKSGHAYVPIDITFPEARINDIIESCASSCLLNVGGLDYNSEKLNMISADEIRDIIVRYSGRIPDKKYRVSKEDNYYILYTSGSTGKPKGVQITKNCVDNFINWYLKYCTLSEGKNVFMNMISYSFDVSVIDIYIGLSTGKSLFVIDKEMISNYKDLFDNFRKSDIALWVSTPSFAEMCLVDDSFNSSLLPKLEKMHFLGEVLTKKLINQLKERFPGVRIYNGYGPTEATVAITAVEISDDMMKDDNSLPIGYTIEGSKIVIVDENNRSVPIGEKGELVIIGDCVSPGYYNNEIMTKKNFFTVEEDEKVRRAYRTGDIAFMKENGLIYYCGRKDFQIKLNGQRIEIEDIENNLRLLDFINNAVVLPVYKNDKISHLTAFITLKNKSEDKEFKVAIRVKNELKALIPSYMIPRSIKVKDSFITNSNGKINRKLLAEELK